ncbi:cytochrome d ubiquinol oxidase subunit II [Xanthobacter tagetidis]|uniref:Cytochrome d ubiquinol oxidase subunit II n=1 Tax=Xanthobacter tagetidis TaxID=60216 RepID=A0A3L7A8T6_9HYPH|nr:cytochrome d ubiquinol oxidase subunit II [Xanthobacter tagetidis]MBB6307244.1 cytochrome d ubiquinol oxidase subunit II [Xanthobacter tagetidis]RLP75792.1 cytochrome d ubiquinol oxidase subunit II [Xanthobacter tagetidis]
MEWYLPVIWGLIIGVAVIMYVILDGFDLGIGILFPFAREEKQRDTMMNTVAPFWDGNETWLILGGGGLWVAFPQAYAVVMPALYLPVIIMLLALVFRGVAFEFRWVAASSRRWWNLAFSGGSLVAAFSQGVILGGLVQGITVANGQFAGGPLDWATPFALLCGLGVVAGYGLLGATWLLIKTEGALAARARTQALPLLYAVLAFMAAVSLWTPLAFDRIAVRWFSTPNIFYLAPVPIVTALVAYLVWRWLKEGREMLPFFGTVGLFLLGFLGLAISTFPYLVPPSLTVWQTAAAVPSQIFMLIGVIFLLPVVLGYIVFVYWIFRGKVREGEGYH